MNIHSVILANHIEERSGLLYISGGGLTEITREEKFNRLGVGIIFIIPRDETYREQQVRFVIADKEEKVLCSAEIRFTAGDGAIKPAKYISNDELPLNMAQMFDVTFPASGIYRLIVSIAGTDEIKWHQFDVRDPKITPITNQRSVAS